MARFSVPDLITHPGREREAASVSQFCFEFSGHAKHDVSFGAPVVGQVAGRVFHHANPDVAQVLRSPDGMTMFAGMFGFRYVGPSGGEKWQRGQFHALSIFHFIVR